MLLFKKRQNKMSLQASLKICQCNSEQREKFEKFSKNLSKTREWLFAKKAFRANQTEVEQKSLLRLIHENPRQFPFCSLN